MLYKLFFSLFFLFLLPSAFAQGKSLGLKTIDNFHDLDGWKKEQRDSIIGETLLGVLGLKEGTPNDFKQYDLYEDIELNQKKVKKVFSLNGSRDLNNYQNFLSFSYGDLNGIPNSYGYCHGYTYISSVLRHLLHFDPHYHYSKKLKGNYEERLLTILKLIETSVYELKPVIIPGYSGLQELSSQPYVEKFLQVMVAKFWAKKNSELYESGHIFLTTKKYIDSNLDVKEMGKLLSVNYWPIIAIIGVNPKGRFQDSYIHVKPLLNINGRNFLTLETTYYHNPQVEGNDGLSSSLYFFEYNIQLGGKIAYELRHFYKSNPTLGLDLEQDSKLDGFKVAKPIPYAGQTVGEPSFLQQTVFMDSLGQQP